MLFISRALTYGAVGIKPLPRPLSTGEGCCRDVARRVSTQMNRARAPSPVERAGGEVSALVAKYSSSATAPISLIKFKISE